MINFKVFSLLESILEVDSNLIQIIKYLKDRDDVIANQIYPLIKKDINTHVNYLRPSSQDDMFFIPDSQVEKTKEKGGDLWSGKNTTKVGRTWRQILKDNNISYTDTDIEKFVNKYKNAYKKLILKESIENFKLVDGEDIRYWYLEDNYYPGGGTLNKSCMRYKSCQKYLDIYTDNIETCKLLILLEGDKLLGRALIWKLKDGDYYLDRIYTRWDNDVDTFKEYFEENFDGGRSYSDGDDSSHLYVKVKKVEYDYYPYMDSFNFLNIETSELSTYNNDNEVYYELTSTDGEYEATGVWSESEDRYISYNNAVETKKYGWISTNRTEIDKFSGIRFLKTDAVNSVYGLIDKYESFKVSEDNWIPIRDLYYIQKDGEWIPIPFKYYSKDHEDLLPKDYVKIIIDKKRCLVSSKDVVKGFSDSPDILKTTYDENKSSYFSYYIIDSSLIEKMSIDIRSATHYQKVGYYNNSPTFLILSNQFIIDEFLMKKYNLSGELYAYSDDMVEYIKSLYYLFDFIRDKQNLDIYNLNDGDISYLCDCINELNISIKYGDKYLDAFIEPINAFLKNLKNIDFSKFENHPFFIRKREAGFNNSQIIQSSVIEYIFDLYNIYTDCYKKFIIENGLPKITPFESSPIDLGHFNINRFLSGVIYGRSRRNINDELCIILLEYTLNEVKKFCSSNNL